MRYQYVNHLFLWAMFHNYVSHYQRVSVHWLRLKQQVELLILWDFRDHLWSSGSATCLGHSESDFQLPPCLKRATNGWLACHEGPWRTPKALSQHWMISWDNKLGISRWEWKSWIIPKATDSIWMCTWIFIAYTFLCRADLGLISVQFL